MALRLADEGPAGWRTMEAVFAMTVSVDLARAVFLGDEGSTPVEPSASIIALVREHRERTARLGDGPWWRMLLSMTKSGEIEVDYDYGDEPFPDDHLFPPEAYRADLDEYPRDWLPLWLAAYVSHGDRQKRSPRHAAEAVRADRAAKVWSELTHNEFPDFPLMWARWATIAAAFVAVGSQWGPRVLPALGWFESSRRGGSTLYVLPGDRAVLSGGVWDAPSLDAAYNDSAGLPRLFAGAPDWVADPVLNPRADTGLLSFCYWWEGDRWYRGESPPAEQCATAVPGVWTAGTVTGIVAKLAADRPTEQQQRAAQMLVSVAEQGVVTRDALVHVFGDDGRRDIDSALYQFSLAGLTNALPPQELPEEQAILRVRQYIEAQGLDTTGYPLSELVADRFSIGWMVYVPGGGIGRAIFYVDDDGVLEHSSSSTAPLTFIAGFERRFRKRHTPAIWSPD
ncbi:hypothetical protein BFF78_39315 [Streptomyces fodineus]|uniref:Uncharacterized protein n=1 Tax=Streptomyces fodineus TaxID=1904616 RepID=A0A1D7YPW5_9ACTN|nr:hypothetical protein BFF78_39315 [Streptomyces fodineus]